MEKLTGLILAKKTYREYDELVWFFTEEFGLISAILRGVKKKRNQFRGELPVFSYVHVDINVRQGLSIISDFEVIDRHYTLADQVLPLFLYGGQLGELVQRVLGEKQPVNGLLFILRRLFRYVVLGACPTMGVTFLGQKLLPYTGAYLSLDACGHCGNNKNIIAFSYQLSGLVCQDCKSNLQGNEIIDANKIKALVAFSRLTLEKFEQITFDDQTCQFLEVFWDEIYHDHLGVYLKSKKVAKSIREPEVLT
ncbi:MAG: DNA repair protein RecO [Culicoidibacterales bacterium]